MSLNITKVMQNLFPKHQVVSSDEEYIELKGKKERIELYLHDYSGYFHVHLYVTPFVKTNEKDIQNIGMLIAKELSEEKSFASMSLFKDNQVDPPVSILDIDIDEETLDKLKGETRKEKLKSFFLKWIPFSA